MQRNPWLRSGRSLLVGLSLSATLRLPPFQIICGELSVRAVLFRQVSVERPVPGRIRLPGAFFSLACGHAGVDKSFLALWALGVCLVLNACASLCRLSERHRQRV